MKTKGNKTGGAQFIVPLQELIMKNNVQINFKRNIILLLVIAFIIINVTFCYSEVFAFSFTTSDSTGPMTVDFGSVSPKEPAVAIPHCAEILIAVSYTHLRAHETR